MLIDRWVCYPSVYQRRRGTRITAAVESVSDGLESQRERERERASSFGTTWRWAHSVWSSVRRRIRTTVVHPPLHAPPSPFLLLLIFRRPVSRAPHPSCIWIITLLCDSIPVNFSAAGVPAGGLSTVVDVSNDICRRPCSLDERVFTNSRRTADAPRRAGARVGSVTPDRAT